MTDYTKLARQYLSDYLEVDWTIGKFAKWLDERASREEEISGERITKFYQNILKEPTDSARYDTQPQEKPVAITPSDSDFHAKARGEDKPVCPDCGGARYHYADDGTREVHKCYYGNDPTPSKALEELDAVTLRQVLSARSIEGLTMVTDTLRAKISELISYVKELEKRT